MTHFVRYCSLVFLSSNSKVSHSSSLSIYMCNASCSVVILEAKTCRLSLNSFKQHHQTRTSIYKFYRHRPFVDIKYLQTN